jgi:peptide/nickel transport system substrate-binding protein
MASNWLRNSRAITYIGLTLILFAAVACGSASAPADTAPAPAVPAAAEQAAVPAPDKAAAPASPTAVPKAVSEPAMVEVHPGKVTWMTSNFGSERFDIIFDSGGAGRQYAELIHGFMIDSDMVDGKRQMVPGIVTKWELSSDALTWNLTVGKGAKFHDGTDLTAEDVLWTYRHIIGADALDYSTAVVARSIGNHMLAIEQVGTDTITVETDIIMTDIVERMSENTGAIYGALMPKRETMHDREAEKAYNANPIGAGLMKLVEHVPADRFTFERFDDYYYQPKNGLPTDKRTKFAELDLLLVKEEATRVAALRAGDADIAPISPGSRVQVEAGGGRMIFGPEGQVWQVRALGCHVERFPCYDKRVRLALNYALDKELIRDKLYGPEYMVLKGWFAVTPGSLGYSPGLDPWPFDPVKARELLTEAGYKNPDNPGGKDFGKLWVDVAPEVVNPLTPETAQIAADMWSKHLGLDVEVKVWDSSARSKARRVKEPDNPLYGHIYFSTNEGRIDPRGTTRTSHANPTYAARMIDPDKDPELFALVEEVLGTIDPVEQEKKLISMYQRIRGEGHWIPLGYVNSPWGVGPRILTWEPLPASNYPSGLHTITLK